MATESSSSVASAEVSGGDHGGLKVGYHTAQGLRDSMEDHLVVIRDIPGGFLYAGIFDGHAGSASARFLKDELYIDCMDALEGGALLSDEDLDAVEEALQDAFIQADQRLLQWLAEHSEEPESGSTGTVAFVRKDRLFIAHLGDSRAVLGVGGDTEDLSQDHKPHGESPIAKAEIKRIEKAGGWVSQGRVCGVVAVSRAFGNANFKTRREQMLSEGVKKGRWTTRFVSKRSFQSDWISAVPDVYAAEVEEDAEFVIIASDGLWEGVKSSEAVAFVRRELESHGDIQQATDNLASFALQDRKGEDNISIARGRSVSGGGVDGDTWRGGWERGDAWRMAGKASSAKLREAFKYCVDQVRKHDSEHYIGALYMPAQHRPTQFALRAFNVETSLIPDRAREHRLAIIRLAWWRDALTRLFQGQPPEDHPVLVALGAVRQATGITKPWLMRVIAARMEDLERAAFPPNTIADVEQYADSTSSALLYLSLQAAGINSVHADHAASHVGKAEGMALLLRGASYHAAQRRSHIPLDVAAKLLPSLSFPSTLLFPTLPTLLLPPSYLPS
ncbi:unnamed protein product [Closterium sp. NIES-64]|nr:unnamed protein product [Closterium sp. NIES-64]